MTKIEEIARAVGSVNNYDAEPLHTVLYESEIDNIVRAVLQSLLPPSKEMVEAGDVRRSAGRSTEAIEAIFTAMIQSALEEK